MVELQVPELQRLISLFSELNLKKTDPASLKQALTMSEKGLALDTLRSKFPDLFSGLDDRLIKDDNFLIKFLSNPQNWNKIRDKVLNNLTTKQNIELAKSFIQPVAAGEITGEQPVGQAEQAGTMQSGTEATSGQSSVPSMGGLPSAPSISMPQRAYKMPQVPKPEKSDIAIANKSGAVIREQPLRYSSGFGSRVKDIGSRAQLLANKAGRGIMNGLRNMAGGAVRGGGDILAKGLNSGIPGRGTLGRARKFTGNTGSAIGKAGKKRWLLMLFGLLFGGALIGGLVTSSNPTGQPISTAPITGGDISSCQFYRAKETATYKSNLLLDYISEASSLSGIPPVVLAAFIRVESPASVGKNDDQIRNYAASCVAKEPGYVSETGALGIMQIQPPGTKSLKGDAASCNECIDAGARLIGKTVQAMTTADYCDPRTNIIVGAGFILKKMEYPGYKNSGKWDPAWTNDQSAINTLVSSYYGALKYTDENGKEQDYGSDVWTSIQNCKPSSQSGTRGTTPSIDETKLKDSLISQFGIAMNGFDNAHMQWAWEKLWDVSNTNFTKLTGGSVIDITDNADSHQVGCPGDKVAVYLGQYPETLFKYALIHELGHVIRNCSKTAVSSYVNHLNALNKEGAVTYYANNASSCTGSDNISEDYAEMIALYLNPSANIQMVKCAPAGTKYTNLSADFPLHYNVVKSVLGDF